MSAEPLGSAGPAERLLWQLDGRLLDVLDALCQPESGQPESGQPESGGAAEPVASFERVEAGAYVVVLPGSRRPSTVVWLIAGPQAVAVEAFVLHVTAECSDPAPLHRLLLSRNLRLRDVHFALDEVGDVFLTGSLPHAAVDAASVDRVLGEVLQLLEADQDALVRAAYGEVRRPGTGGPPTGESLAAKVWTDGAGRRPAGTPVGAPHRDVRR